MTGARRPRAWVRGRNYARGPQLDTFLVCAASAVVLNRAVLVVLGYPQIGSREPGGIHISHSIYGGIMMLVAMVVAISFLAPATRWFLSILGGLGFGWWVDELGKYVSNAGYLFRPALALIYVTFVVLFLVARSLASRGFGPEDAIANALESVKAAALGSLDHAQRREALARLDAAAPQGALAGEVRALLADAPASPPRPPGALARGRARIRARYRRWSERRSFTVVIEVFFALYTIATFGWVLGLGLDGPGITRPSERVATAAASVAGAFVVIGLVQLYRSSRLEAYRWFDRALLVRILVLQVYLFRQNQFAAVAGLGVDLFIWAMVRSAMAVEERTARVGLGPDGPANGGPTGEAPDTREPAATP